MGIGFPLVTSGPTSASVRNTAAHISPEDVEGRRQEYLPASRRSSTLPCSTLAFAADGGPATVPRAESGLSLPSVSDKGFGLYPTNRKTATGNPNNFTLHIHKSPLVSCRRTARSGKKKPRSGLNFPPRFLQFLRVGPSPTTFPQFIDSLFCVSPMMIPLMKRDRFFGNMWSQSIQRLPCDP